MRFAKDFERAIMDAARDGAKDLVLEQAAAVKAGMGARGDEISFSWSDAGASGADQLGALSVTGPSEDVVEEFNLKLREHLGQ